MGAHLVGAHLESQGALRETLSGLADQRMAPQTTVPGPAGHPGPGRAVRDGVNGRETYYVRAETPSPQRGVAAEAEARGMAAEAEARGLVAEAAAVRQVMAAEARQAEEAAAVRQEMAAEAAEARQAMAAEAAEVRQAEAAEAQQAMLGTTVEIAQNLEAVVRCGAAGQHISLLKQPC